MTDRDANHDLTRTQTPSRENGRPHRRPGRQPVVGEDGDTATQVEGGPSPAVNPLSPIQLDAFARDDASAIGGGHPAEFRARVHLQDASGRNGANGELGLAGVAQLADPEGVQGSRQPARDHRSDDDAAARQAEHGDVRTAGELRQQTCHGLPGCAAVLKPPECKIGTVHAHLFGAPRAPVSVSLHPIDVTEKPRYRLAMIARSSGQGRMRQMADARVP